MANYVDSFTSLSACSFNVPGHHYLCLALGLAGLVCMAWGLSIGMRTPEMARVVVEIETDRD